MHERLHNKLLYTILFKIWRSWAKREHLQRVREAKKKLGKWFGLWKLGLKKQAEEEEAERQRLIDQRDATGSANAPRQQFNKPKAAVVDAIQENSDEDSDEEDEEGDDLLPLEIHHHHHTQFSSTSPNAKTPSPKTRRNSQWGMAMLEQKQKSVSDEDLLQSVIAQTAALEGRPATLGTTASR